MDLCFTYDHEHKSRLDPWCKQGTFIVYNISSPAFLVYFSENRQVKRIRRVNFPRRQIFPDSNNLEDI